jgi:NAD(P)-dependent dehydrogenase (short-subunit alcohol dehydrogenase family)
MDQQRIEQYRNAAEKAARRQRAIQVEIDSQDRREQQSSGNQQPGRSSPQTGLQEPSGPMPAQHLVKPGLEAELELRPRYEARQYKGSEKLKDMVAIVTGGDSGIGRAVAVLFAREGADVAVIYLSEHEDAEETRRAVEKEGRRCIAISGDVTDAQFCRDAVQHVVGEFGRLDILVNNAAFQEHARSLQNLSEEHFDLTVRTNLYGYFHMAKAALPHLAPGSSIINSGSETGFFGSEQLLDYSATKGAIHALTRSLASNLIEEGIRVNAVAPGPVWTPLNPADRPADQVAKFGSQTAMKRPAQPEEIAPAYVFLASPVCSSYITGTILPIMGGTPGG